jgi:micrococcal nuclease
VSARRALPWIAVFAVLALVGGGVLHLPGRSPSARLELGPGRVVPAVVTRVVDGDTVKVAVRGASDTVRYIGIDTPETRRPGTPIQCFGKAASAYNRQLVDGQPVTLRTDVEPRDRYGRLLAYVYRRRDGLFVNATLVARGFATILTIPPNVAHVEEFLRLERRARASGIGLWTACR